MIRLQLKYYYSKGFSLLELAIVLFVLTLVLGGLLAPLATRSQMEEIKNTRDQLVEIRESLYGFTLLNGRLPCPDCSDSTGSCAGPTQNDGFEDMLTGGTCATNTGNLPWVTLGIKEMDSWNRRYVYSVDAIFSRDIDENEGFDTCLPNGSVAFTLCDSGSIVVRNASAGDPIAIDLPALVLSYGPGGLDTSSTDELENMDNDNIFVDRDFSQATGSEFDDLLIWISPHQLRSKMVNAGLLP